MKYNPKVHEKVAALPGFAAMHPGRTPCRVQGTLGSCTGCRATWRESLGLDAVTLQPAAGAQEATTN